MSSAAGTGLELEQMRAAAGAVRGLGACAGWTPGSCPRWPQPELMSPHVIRVTNYVTYACARACGAGSTLTLSLPVPLAYRQWQRPVPGWPGSGPALPLPISLSVEFHPFFLVIMTFYCARAPKSVFGQHSLQKRGQTRASRSWPIQGLNHKFIN